MKHLPVLLASVILAISYSPSAQAAPITYQRITELCRPQMEAIIPGSISYLEAQVAEWQQALEKAGFHIDASSKAYPNQWLIENRYRGSVAIFEFADGALQALPFPETHMLMVAVRKT